MHKAEESMVSVRWPDTLSGNCSQQVSALEVALTFALDIHRLCNTSPK